MQRSGTALGTLRNELEPAIVIDDNETSALGESFVLVRWFLHEVMWTRSRDF